ncbi:hypothetical protein V8C86DRAFT_2622815 [Haematococcus lacustris]
MQATHAPLAGTSPTLPHHHLSDRELGHPGSLVSSSWHPSCGDPAPPCAQPCMDALAAATTTTITATPCMALTEPRLNAHCLPPQQPASIELSGLAAAPVYPGQVLQGWGSASRHFLQPQSQPQLQARQSSRSKVQAAPAATLPPAQSFARGSKRWGQAQLHPQQALVDAMLARRLSGTGCSAPSTADGAVHTAEVMAASDQDVLIPFDHQSTAWPGAQCLADSWMSTGNCAVHLPELPDADSERQLAGNMSCRARGWTALQGESFEPKRDVGCGMFDVPLLVGMGSEGPDLKRVCRSSASAPSIARVLRPHSCSGVPDGGAQSSDLQSAAYLTPTDSEPSIGHHERPAPRTGRPGTPSCRPPLTEGIVRGVVNEALKSISTGPLQLPGGQRPSHTRLLLHNPGQCVQGRPILPGHTSGLRAGATGTLGGRPLPTRRASYCVVEALPAPCAARPAGQQAPSGQPDGSSQLSVLNSKLQLQPRPMRPRARTQPGQQGPILPPILTGFEGK